MSFVAGSQGFEPPDPARPFRYLELGCGHGATLNGLAAACPHGTFIGVDFNPGLIRLARAAAEAAGLGNVRYIEAAFSGLDTGALAGCDYLACNGTWSWLEPGEKAALIRVAGETLRSGGLFYLGYASLGRHSITPMWHVLRRLVPEGGSGSLERMRAGIALLVALRDQGARFLAEQPKLLDVLNSIQAQLAAGDQRGLENLAHNALAEAYSTALVDEVAADLAPAGLGFCGSADLFLNDPDLCVPDGIRARHDQLTTRIQQELLKDFMRSSAGRRDIFIRNPEPAAGGSRAWLDERAQATLTLPREAARQQFLNPGWTAFRYTTPEIEFVFERLADGVTGLQEVAGDSVYTAAELRDAFVKLVACPGIEPCIGPSARTGGSIPPRVRTGSGFNQQALESAAAGAGAVQLASPVLGSCLELPGPEARHLAILCEQGTGAVVPGTVAAASQWFLAERLPLLLRLGALVPA